MITGMSLREFLMQYEWCRKENNPEGYGCEGCLGKDRIYCADRLVRMQDDVIIVVDTTHKRVVSLNKR